MLVPVLAQAGTNCQKNPIYCEILTLQPSIDKKFAKDLSNSISKYSKAFGTDPTISVAIAMQESTLKNKNRMGSVATKDGRVVYGVTDVGVFQIHIHTIANIKEEGLDIDVIRLQNDVDYQTYWHTKILKKKIVTCRSQREKLNVELGNEWSCYHSFTPSQRRIYLRDVSVHLAKLNSI